MTIRQSTRDSAFCDFLTLMKEVLLHEFTQREEFLIARVHKDLIDQFRDDVWTKYGQYIDTEICKLIGRHTDDRWGCYQRVRDIRTDHQTVFRSGNR